MFFLALTGLQLGVALGLRPVQLTRQNPLLPVAVAGSFLLALAGVYVPVPPGPAGHPSALPAAELALAVGTGALGWLAARVTRSSKSGARSRRVVTAGRWIARGPGQRGRGHLDPYRGNNRPGIGVRRRRCPRRLNAATPHAPVGWDQTTLVHVRFAASTTGGVCFRPGASTERAAPTSATSWNARPGRGPSGRAPHAFGSSHQVVLRDRRRRMRPTRAQQHRLGRGASERSPRHRDDPQDGLQPCES